MIVSAYNITMYLCVFFSRSVLIFFLISCFLPSFLFRFLLLFISLLHFFGVIPIPIFWLYILTALYYGLQIFFIFGQRFDVIGRFGICTCWRDSFLWVFLYQSDLFFYHPSSRQRTKYNFKLTFIYIKTISIFCFILFLAFYCEYYAIIYIYIYIYNIYMYVCVCMCVCVCVCEYTIQNRIKVVHLHLL